MYLCLNIFFMHIDWEPIQLIFFICIAATASMKAGQERYKLFR